MKRLTHRYSGGGTYVIEKSGENMVSAVVSRLAAYEDTGLTPEDIQAMKVELESLRSKRIPVIRMRDEVKG